MSNHETPEELLEKIGFDPMGPLDDGILVSISKLNQHFLPRQAAVEAIGEDEERGDYSENELEDLRFALSKGTRVAPKKIMTYEEADKTIVRNRLRAEIRKKLEEL